MERVNFVLVLFLLVVVTGCLWGFNFFYASRRRQCGCPDPWWMEWGGGFFPVLLSVFLIRSFLVEPFRIPSESMLPTLLVGDFILVNKFVYGIRLPMINKKVISIKEPERGDIIVFRYPRDVSIDYIKRVVGIPGDEIVYRNKELLINNVSISKRRAPDYLNTSRLVFSERYQENLLGVFHYVLNDSDRTVFPPPAKNFINDKNCSFSFNEIRCHVPDGSYFVMGDNRDNSSDSRVWGFVPEEYIVGKAFFVWFHAGGLFPPLGIKLSRIGPLI
ncbi:MULTISPECIES: signal peptidase I [Candidatus Ichthyocystis]|uniref:Signal peptidase I n=1 Tax=Candidatus Ichthyocystis hellenicum TaxID=1561003 RepID=A0A0S4M2Z5_9BURK|nr:MULTISPECIES: signal peptidase I [Ichthyocystis]CUT17600.1 Signal peptidase I [Candidatus Ichthyocystis hellenicum]